MWLLFRNDTLTRKVYVCVSVWRWRKRMHQIWKFIWDFPIAFCNAIHAKRNRSMVRCGVQTHVHNYRHDTNAKCQNKWDIDREWVWMKRQMLVGTASYKCISNQMSFVCANEHSVSVGAVECTVCSRSVCCALETYLSAIAKQTVESLYENKTAILPRCTLS